MDAFVSWSGGKDSAYAYYMAKRDGLKVKILLNMAAEDGKRGHSHGLSMKALKRQSRAMGLILIQKKTSWEDYETRFKEALKDLKTMGITAGIFGDIDLADHREWVERVCAEEGVTPFLPLWLKDRKELMETFIWAGFKAKVVAVNNKWLDNVWLGREIDMEFVADLMRLNGVDLCGEKGEYHTFVYDGPLFKKPLDFKLAGRYHTMEHTFLDIKVL